MSYILSITIEPDHTDLATGLLSLLDTQGFEEISHQDSLVIKAYFASRTDAQSAQEYLANAIPLKQHSLQEAQEQDWNAKWRESIEPVLVTDSLWVSPTWRPPILGDNQHWIKIEPKMAFGSGHHETTQLCARTLAESKRTNPNLQSLLDIGTGSGILCFVAEHLGYARCTGIEIDPDCLDNLAENRLANQKTASHNFYIGSSDALTSSAQFDCVVMNMISARSQPLLQQAYSLTSPQGVFVWSGILTEESSEMKQSAKEIGFALQTEYTAGEWWSGCFCLEE